MRGAEADPCPAPRRRGPSSLGARQLRMQAQRQADDLLHVAARIERGVGVLEDDLHARPQRRERRVASRLARSTPSKQTLPAVGSRRRNARRPSVDLPQPLSPIRPRHSPRAMRQVDVRRPRAPCAAGRRDNSPPAPRRTAKCRLTPAQLDQRTGVRRRTHLARWQRRRVVHATSCIGCGRSHAATRAAPRAANRQPGGRCVRSGMLPGIGRSGTSESIQPRQARPAAPAV